MRGGTKICTEINTLEDTQNSQKSIVEVQINKTDSIKKRKNPNVFDITTGSQIPKSDVAHRILEDSENSAIYPMQHVDIAGQRVLILYDSGAKGEAIKTDIAEKVKMSIIDARPQSYSVAGGSIVHTENPLYEVTMGPDTHGDYHTFSLLGMDKISDQKANPTFQRT